MTTPNARPQPEVIARGLLVEAGRVLLCRNVAKGYLYLPGGHVESGETAADALARELAEEAGLEARIGACRLVSELLADGLHEINLVFHVERIGDGPIASREPEIGFEWVDLAAIVDADLRPTSVRAWLATGGTSENDPVSFVSET